MQAKSGVFNKSHLIDSISKMNPDLKLGQVERAVDLFFEEISTALVCGDRVELRGFGSMVVRKRSSNYVRNPKTNEKVLVGDRGSLYFRASKGLLGSLNATNDNK